MMSSKVVLTYKRRRPPSRFDLSHKNVCFEAQSKCQESKASATLDKYEEPIEENKFAANQNNESEIFHEHCRGKVGDSMFQCQSCYRNYWIELLNPPVHASKEKRLCSCCIKEEDSLSRLGDETLSVESDVTQARFHSKSALLDGIPKKICSHETKLEKLTLEELDLARKDKCSSICNNSAAKRKFTSTLITFSRRSKQNKDTAGPNPKSNIKAGENSSLPAEGCTFASAVSTCTFETPPDKSCSNDYSEDLKKEKDVQPRESFVRDKKEVYIQENDYKSEFPASAPETEIGIQVDEQLKSLHKTDNGTSSTVVQLSPDSLNFTSHSYVAMDVQENHPVNTSRNLSDVPTEDLEHKVVKSLSNEDLNKTELPDALSRNKYAEASRILSVAAPASDIDCNLALDSGSHEPYYYNAPPSKKMENLNGKIKENMLTHEAQIPESGCSLVKAIDKSNDCVKHPPHIRDITSKNNYLQLFPENRSHDLLPSASMQQKASAFVESEESLSQLKSPAVTRSSLFLGLSLPPMEPTVAFNPMLYQWPNVNIQPQETFHDFGPQPCSGQTSSLLRHKMVLDNILRRGRVANGNRGSFSDRFESPTTWSEEELDCLWIGVRRHGRGNWDTMLKDPRLRFFPWRTPRDLAERWDEDQSKLMYSMAFPQLKYASNQDVLSYGMKHFPYPKIKHRPNDVQLSLGDVPPRYEDSVKNISPMDFINIQHNGLLQKPVTDSRNFPSYSCTVSGAESSLHMGPMMSIAVKGCCAVSGAESSLHTSPMMSMAVKGCSLPPWLREAVAISPRPPGTAPASFDSSTSHPGMQLLRMQYVNSNLCHQQARNRLNNKHTIPGKTELQTGGRSHLTNSPLITRCGKTNSSDNNREDLIIIHSDASSEETISDDQC